MGKKKIAVFVILLLTCIIFIFIGLHRNYSKKEMQSEEVLQTLSTLTYEEYNYEQELETISECYGKADSLLDEARAQLYIASAKLAWVDDDMYLSFSNFQDALVVGYEKEDYSIIVQSYLVLYTLLQDQKYHQGAEEILATIEELIPYIEDKQFESIEVEYYFAQARNALTTRDGKGILESIKKLPSQGNTQMVYSDLRLKLLYAYAFYYNQDFESCKKNLDEINEDMQAYAYAFDTQQFKKLVYYPYKILDILSEVEAGNYEDALKENDVLIATFIENKQYRYAIDMLEEMIVQLQTPTNANQYEEKLSSYQKQLLTLYPIKNEENMLITSDALIMQNITLADSLILYESNYRMMQVIIYSMIGGSILIVIFTVLGSKLLKRNRHDALTGLYNRSYFDRKYGDYIKHRKPFSILLLDIDHFKTINDTYGHAFGDEILRSLSKKMKEVVGSKARIYRYGGEEFCIVDIRHKKGEVIALANELLQSVQCITWGDGRPLTVSIGVALASEAYDKTEIGVFELADAKLYKAKEAGRNQVVFNT